MYNNFYPYDTQIAGMPCNPLSMMIDQIVAFQPNQPNYSRKEKRTPAGKGIHAKPFRPQGTQAQHLPEQINTTCQASVQ